jgi:tetratricopeptide (TPR) repeat protein
VRPLLPGGGDSQLLITSRRLLAGLEGVQRLHLDPMPATDAFDLLSRIVAERATVTGDDDVRDLVGLLGGLPLALRIVGNRLISRPTWSAAELVVRLSAEEQRLEQLRAGDLEVEAAFTMSYEQLPDGTRQLFRRVSLVPGPDFSASLAAVLAGVTVPVADDQLDDLVDLGLAETAQGNRYRLHDLVRLYANQRLQREDPADTVVTVRRRMVGWLLTTLTAAARMFGPDGGGSDDSVFASAEDARDWIRIEVEHWFPALGAAAMSGDHRAVVRAAAAMHWFCEHWVHWPRWAELFTLGLDSATQLGDAASQAEFLNYLAWSNTLPWHRDMPAALGYAQRALVMAREAGDVKQEAWALQYAGAARRGTGDLEGALTALRRAGELFEQLGDVYAISQALLGLGTVAFDLGDAPEALAAYQRALALVEDSAFGMAASWAETSLPHALGLTARALGRVGRREEAIPMMVRAAELFGSRQVTMGQASWLQILGEELYGEDHAAEARASLLRAADLYESVGQHDRAAECRARAAELGSAGGT